MCNTIGILGGMGPFATLDLFQKILLNTSAQTDQAHLHIIINNNPKIPPRIQDPTSSSLSPLPELIKSALALERAGADFIIMPCHTAHIWINEVKQALHIPFYSMVEHTVAATIREYGRQLNKTILLLATATTIQAQLYQQAFENSPFQIIIPTKEEQKLVDQEIKRVKGGNVQMNQDLAELNQLIETYHKQGTSLLLGCCTEIPLMFPYLKTDIDMIDPTLLLAKMAIAKTGVLKRT